jgi:hypothetical protein
MPVLRRAVVTAIIPPNLQPPAVALLERLPTSICGLSLGDIQNLPWLFKREVCPLGAILRPGQGDSGLQSWAVTLAEVAMGAASRSNGSATHVRAEAWVARMCRCVRCRGARMGRESQTCCDWRHAVAVESCACTIACLGANHPFNSRCLCASAPAVCGLATRSVIYAPEASCGNSTEDGGLNATELAVQRIADEYKPITVKLLSAALAAMPATTRKQLTEGLAKQVDSVPGLVAMLPKEVKSAFLSTACYVATPLATLEVDPDAPLLDHVTAGKAYSNEALDLAGLLVGEDKAAVLKDKICADAPKPPPVLAAADSAESDTSTTVGYVKGKISKVARGSMFLLQGMAARLGKTLLPSQAH